MWTFSNLRLDIEKQEDDDTGPIWTKELARLRVHVWTMSEILIPQSMPFRANVSQSLSRKTPEAARIRGLCVCDQW